MASAVTAAVPDPALIRRVVDPNAALVPYSNTYVVAAPFGLMVPVSVTAFAVVVVGEPVVAVGAVAAETACVVRALPLVAPDVDPVPVEDVPVPLVLLPVAVGVFEEEEALAAADDDDATQPSR